MAPSTRQQKNKEIIYEPQKRKDKKSLKIEDEAEEMVIDTMTKSLYMDKSSEHVVILQTHDVEKSYEELVIQYIPEGYYHVPTMIGKTQRYYEKILIETGSMKVQHNY